MNDYFDEVLNNIFPTILNLLSMIKKKFKFTLFL